MNSKDFLDLLKSKILLFDGGFGTELYKRGIYINKCYEELNLSNPSLVQQIHTDYVNSGADVIETNTFGANFFKLQKHGFGDKIYEINFQGAAIAKRAAGDRSLVAGSIGPLGVMIEPLGPISKSEVCNYYSEQIKGLVDGNVDLLIFETFVYSNELKCAVASARKLTEIPIIAQMTIDEDGNSLTGASSADMFAELVATGADVVGINCTAGPKVMLEWLEKVRKENNMPISIMPNAGKPKNIDGRNIYLTSPEYMGEYAKHFIQSGACVIGGCCGTGPEHIKKMRNAVNALKPSYVIKAVDDIVTDNNRLKTLDNIVKPENKSRLAKRIKSGTFVKFVELLSPRGSSAVNEINKSRELYYNGIDVINIPDGPRASARMSALALAVQIQREVGIETVLHYVCRDRNVIGIQSDLLGAFSLGLKNILAITGDPPKLGNYPDATAVFDVDSIGLVNIINRLNRGMDIAGDPLGNYTGFFIGVGANPGALNLDEEIKKLEWKIEAGAEYVITQPVFDVDVFMNFMERIKAFNIPVIAGIWPLTSLRNAEFMNNEIPGCNVPELTLKRLAKFSGSKEDSLKEGITIARELFNSILPHINGIQISAPFGRIQSVFELLDGFNV